MFRLLALALLRPPPALAERRLRTGGGALVGHAPEPLVAAPHAAEQQQREQPPHGHSLQQLTAQLPPRAFRDLEPDDEEFLKRNLWRGQGMHGEFRFMDDLEPVAPMDELGPPGQVSRLDAVAYGAPGTPSDALYVPPYLHPDAFPAVVGGSCTCKGPRVLQPNPDKTEWMRRVAKSLGVRVSELPVPNNLHGDTRCKCNNTRGDAYHWVKAEPVPGSRKYVLSPADITYAAGDYWHPHVRGGLVAPQDKMPADRYPLQARGDQMETLPASAVEDRVGTRLAVYVDQLEARARECDGVSPGCTVECSKGDQVEMHLGNTRLNATVVRFVGGAGLVVEFTPAAADFLPTTPTPCPVEAGCTPFRTCYGTTAYGLHGVFLRRRDGPIRPSCVPQEGLEAHDYMGRLMRASRCPEGTLLCRSVQQTLAGSRLRKGGKACRVGPPDSAAG